MDNGGRYPATPKVELLADGRIIKLTEPFVYIDPRTKAWTAPKNAQADGASIPRLLWPIIGSPLFGLYRDASIIHDFYCSKRHERWKDVHRAFFEAMITSRVPFSLAKVMYAGVYLGGPRWSDMDVANANVLFESQLQRVAGEVESWEEKEERSSQTYSEGRSDSVHRRKSGSETHTSTRTEDSDLDKELYHLEFLSLKITPPKVFRPHELSERDVDVIRSRYENDNDIDLGKIEEELERRVLQKDQSE